MNENPYEPPNEMPARPESQPASQLSIAARTRLASGLSGIMVLGVGTAILRDLTSIVGMLVLGCIVVALGGWLMWNAFFLKE